MSLLIFTMKELNLYGTYSLYKREVNRFLKIVNQTVIAPVISGLIFLAIFTLALNGKNNSINGIDFIDFMSYGVIIMTILQNSFANSSSSMIMGKVLGYINDILFPPLGSIEIIIAYTLGAVTRGIIVGVVTYLALLPIANFQLHNLLLLLYFTFAACTLMGMLGVLTGIASNSFEQNASITSYIINPLSFLSGTFYSVEKLPTFFQSINLINPFFYIIDGFRYSLTGKSDSNVILGVIILFVSNILIFMLLQLLISKGWRIKH